MTAQIPDLCLYDDVEYSLAGISDGTLFDPSLLGLEPVSNCTACWRGYQAVFSLVDAQLVLGSLHVTLCEPEGHFVRKEGPTIHGVLPTGPTEPHDLFNNHYVDLNYPLDYTGGLLLARGFLRELYVHMGFHPAWKYTEVVELIFENGVLLQRFDRSERMAEIRQRILESAKAGKRAGPRTLLGVRKFIKRSFDRTYRM